MTKDQAQKVEIGTKLRSITTGGSIKHILVHNLWTARKTISPTPGIWSPRPPYFRIRGTLITYRNVALA